MINLKNNKGVTLIILTITIIVLLIVTGIMIESSNSQLMLKNVSNLYSDIDSISTKVSDYYLKNNSLPIFENNIYLNNSSELETLIKENGGDKSVINSNDDGPYYVLKLSKLENLTLNFGSEYKKWDDTSTFNDYQDLYIINGVTHEIYYPKGIKYKDAIYFSKGTKNEKVEKIQSNSNVTDDDFKIENIENIKKYQCSENDNVIIGADVTLKINTTNLKEDTLEYYWSTEEEIQNEKYTKFSVNEENLVCLMSGQLEDKETYFLNIKAIDINGEKHEIKQIVNFLENSLLD